MNANKISIESDPQILFPISVHLRLFPAFFPGKCCLHDRETLPDGQHKVAGAGGCVRIGGREYRLAPLTLGHFAELKAHLVAQRKNPLAALGAALDQIDSKYHADLMRLALREACSARGATADEIDNYLQCFDGTAHLFWLMAREHQPQLDSLNAARAVLAEYGESRLLELQGLLDQATGFLSDTASLGNSSGQTQAADLAGSASTAL